MTPVIRCNGHPTESGGIRWIDHRHRPCNSDAGLTRCAYDVPWSGCNGAVSASQLDDEGDYCDEHLGMLCTPHRNQAVRGCSMASSLVCGRPLCDKCGTFCGPHGG